MLPSSHSAAESMASCSTSSPRLNTPRASRNDLREPEEGEVERHRMVPPLIQMPGPTGHQSGCLPRRLHSDRTSLAGPAHRGSSRSARGLGPGGSRDPQSDRRDWERGICCARRRSRHRRHAIHLGVNLTASAPCAAQTRAHLDLATFFREYAVSAPIWRSDGRNAGTCA